MRVIDIFCGCGGMSWGMKKLGYEVLLGIDLNEKYTRSYARNFGDSKTLNGDIREISGDEILSRLNLKRGELEFLVGGPPCQGFSKNIPRSARLIESDNNLLVREYLRFADEVYPQNLVIENVAEMKKGFDGQYTDEIFSELHARGYEVISHVFDASEYGVPQRRKRAFFIASRVGKKLSIPPITHALSEVVKHNKNLDMFSKPLIPKVSVLDAISDLPSLNHTDGTFPGTYPSEPNSDYQTLMRKNSNQIINHTARKMSEIQFKRLSSLKPGQGLRDLPAELQTKGGYSGAYGRLTWDMICPTITRWVFHPGSGRWGHPEDIRTLTLRETARIQSFSDDFIFEGTYTDISGQLGNAVPPLLMQAVMSSFDD
jgi:DNA (cytosine-5)-methyltransferase 1